MRKIIFRGKAKVNGDWFYGNYFESDIEGRTHIRTTRKGCLDIDPDTVGQFTGLTDKNGKEIYEGDICSVDTSRYDSRVKNKRYFRTDVRWYGSGLILFGVTQDLWESDRIEIIGNIHDNPSLLTKKE